MRCVSPSPRILERQPVPRVTPFVARVFNPCGRRSDPDTAEFCTAYTRDETLPLALRFFTQGQSYPSARTYGSSLSRYGARYFS